MPLRPLEEIYEELLSLSNIIFESRELNYLASLADDIKAHIDAKDEKKEAKGWQKGRGLIAFDKEKITVEVYRHDRYPGVMIHKKYDVDGRFVLPVKWSISHELSGLRLGGRDYNDMRKAVKAFMEHAADVNWDRPQEDISKDAKALKANKCLFLN